MPHQKRKTLKQILNEPTVIEPVDLSEPEPGTKADQVAQTGSRRRTAAETPQDQEIAAQDDWRQWLPQHQKEREDRQETARPSREESPDPHAAATQPYSGRAAWSGPPEERRSGRRIVEPDGRSRPPDSQEELWLAQYEEERAEMERMDELLADFEEEEQIEQARQEFDGAQARLEQEQSETFQDSDSS